MRKIEVCGFGNSVVDVLLDVTEEEMQKISDVKGDFCLISPDELKLIFEILGEKEQKLVSGGSVANSIMLFAQLGGKAAFMSSLGNDPYGQHFSNEFKAVGIEIPSPLLSNKPNGICLSFITPDAERTMRTCLGACMDLCEEHVLPELIENSDLVFMEGYVFTDGDAAQNATNKALYECKRSDTKLAVTTSASSIVTAFREYLLKDVLPQTYILFANEEEALALAQSDNLEDALRCIGSYVPNYVVTVGAEGAHISHLGKQYHVPAEKSVPVDLTGAGDSYAGSYLYGITHGLAADKAAQAAAKMAKAVIEQKGARLDYPPRKIREIYNRGFDRGISI